MIIRVTRISAKHAQIDTTMGDQIRMDTHNTRLVGDSVGAVLYWHGAIDPVSYALTIGPNQAEPYQFEQELFERNSDAHTAE